LGNHSVVAIPSFLDSFPVRYLDSDAVWLVSVVVALLLAGSAAGSVLKVVVARREPHAVIDNVIERMWGWWAIAALLGLAMLGGRAGACLLFAFASFVALREFLPADDGRRGGYVLRAGAFFLVLPLQYLLVWRGEGCLLFIPALAYAFWVAPVIALIAGDARELPTRLAPLQWGLAICVLGVSYLPALFNLEISGYEDRNGFLLVFLLLVTQLGDVFQYLWGKLAGRRVLAAQVSPDKTVEGTVGGVLSATVLGTALAWVTPFTHFEAAALSLLAALLGVMGGLLSSAIKRDRGIKDWGTLVPGHGGVLDRLDSLCLSAPVFYYWVDFGWSA